MQPSQGGRGSDPGKDERRDAPSTQDIKAYFLAITEAKNSFGRQIDHLNQDVENGLNGV